MIKLAIKFIVLSIVLVHAGCAKSTDEPTGEQSEKQVAEVDISNEAVVDILAYSSYLSIKLSEEYADDQDKMMEEYKTKMEERAADYGLSYEELDMRAYEEKAMENPELLNQVQEKIMELQEQE